MEIQFGFKRTEKKVITEKYDFSYITLEKRIKEEGVKMYSRLKLSKSAILDLNLKDKSNQILGFAEYEKGKFILVNTTGVRTNKDANNFKVNKDGTFSIAAFYNKLIEVYDFDDSKDNYLRVTSFENISFKNKEDESVSAIAIELSLIADTTEIKNELIPEEIIANEEVTFTSELESSFE